MKSKAQGKVEVPFMIFESPKSVIFTFAVIKSEWSSRMFSGFKSLCVNRVRYTSHVHKIFFH